MQIKWFEDLIALAEHGSFVRAAAARHVTHPAFGRRISALERWVGVPLVDRAAHPFALTAAGVQFVDALRHAMTLIGDSRDSLRAARRGGDQRLAIATGRTLARTLLPRLIERAGIDRDVRIEVSSGALQSAAGALRNGDVDLLLCYVHPDLPLMLDASRFEHALIETERLIPVTAARGDSTRHALPGTPRRPVRMIAFSRALALRRAIDQHLAQRGSTLHVRPVVEVDMAEAAHEFVLQGRAMAWLPQALVAADLDAGRLLHAGGPQDAMTLDVRLYRHRAPRAPHIADIWLRLASARPQPGARDGADPIRGQSPAPASRRAAKRSR